MACCPAPQIPETAVRLRLANNLDGHKKYNGLLVVHFALVLIVWLWANGKSLLIVM
jgi:hypothetical protein